MGLLCHYEFKIIVPEPGRTYFDAKYRVDFEYGIGGCSYLRCNCENWAGNQKPLTELVVFGRALPER